MPLSTTILILILIGLAPCRGFRIALPTVRFSLAPKQRFRFKAFSMAHAIDNEDNIERFADDVAKVLKDLRSHPVDPSLPPTFRNLKSSFSNIWSLDRWDRHISRLRYFRCMASMPTSSLMRRIFPQLVVLLLWSCWGVRYAAKIDIGLTPLSLMSTFVAFLLTLRSNQGLSRLIEGRMAWGRAVLFTRDITMLIATYVYPRDKKMGLLMARHVSLFGWMLKSHMRDTADDDIVHTMLPNPVDAAYVLRQRKRPVALIARLRQCVCQLNDDNQLKNPQHNALEKCISELNNVIMICEASRATPIPPIYTHHATRLLVLYLTVLPLALHGACSCAVVTITATLAVGFAMLGLDEISHLYEQPFRLMPLYQLSKTSMLDVADAMYFVPPDFDKTSDELDESMGVKPVYWSDIPIHLLR